MKNHSIYNELYFELKEYINHLYNYYGRNVVVKELRLIPNTITLSKINNDLDVKPLFILLKSNPFQIMHTYYRMGGLIEENDINQFRVNEIYYYRKLSYENLDLFDEELNIDCNNKYEKLLMSIILDYKYMSILESKSEINTISMDFLGASNTIEKISHIIDIPYNEETPKKISGFERYTNDKHYVKNVRKYIRKELLTIVSKEIFYDLTESSKSDIKYYVTSYRNRILKNMV